MYCSYVEHVNGLQGTRDLYTLVGMGARAPRIAVEDWWLLLAREAVATYASGLVVLGRELARVVGRKQAWSHSVLSKFATKKIGATRELQEAICKKFRLPPPIFFPRTLAEASSMFDVQDHYDRVIARTAPPQGSPPATVHKMPGPAERPDDTQDEGASDGDDKPHTHSAPRHRRGSR